MSLLTVFVSCWLAASAAAQADQLPYGEPVEPPPPPPPKVEHKPKPPQPQPQRNRKLLLSTLLGSLRDKDENIRAKAAEDIAAFEPPAVEAVPDLIKVLGDPAPIVRYRAAETLERIGTPKARKAVKKFRQKMARDKSW